MRETDFSIRVLGGVIFMIWGGGLYLMISKLATGIFGEKECKKINEREREKLSISTKHI